MNKERMMNKKVLFYRWGAVTEPLLAKALYANRVCLTEYTREMKDYHADSEFAMEFVNVLHNNKIDMVISYDYFPLISMICEINKIPYASWIYDCPMLTLQSLTLGNAMNHIFCFDRNYTERLKRAGAKNCRHLPLAGDATLLKQILEPQKENPEMKEKFFCDISFVGNLYNDEKNRLRNTKLTEYSQGYLEGIVEAQLQVYGYNFIKESLPDNITSELVNKCHLKLGSLYEQDDAQMAADAIGMEVSARERENVLTKLGQRYDVRLYSGAKLTDRMAYTKIKPMGYADYVTEMPHIFYHSRINLNITSKTIESGVPLRVFDILSCGGFCLTNYQPEIAELFEDGKELVMYTSMEDLLVKVDYYLKNEEERAEIARNGYEKLRTEHGLADRVSMLLSMLIDEKLYQK